VYNVFLFRQGKENPVDIGSKSRMILSAVVLLIAIVSGCTGSGSRERAPFLGTWRGPSNFSETQFFADGKFTQVVPGDTNAGTYEIVQEGKDKYLKMDFKLTTQMYKIVAIDPNGGGILMLEGDQPAALFPLRRKQ
jgi:hypothetical protein